MRRLVPFLLLLSLFACGPVPHPQPPQPAPTFALDVQVSDSESGVADAQVRIVDGPNKGVTARTDATGRVLLTNLQQSGFTVCSSKGVEYQETCAGITLTSSQNVTLKLFRVWASLPRITTDGTIFRVNGQPWVLKGVTAFRLMDRWVRGENIQPFLDAYRGYNTLYVFCYTPANVWGAQSWPSPTPEQVVAFVKAMNQKGWYVEVTLLTNSPDAARLASAKAILAALSAVRTTSASNVLVRLGNEPAEQNGAGNPKYDTRPLQAAADASGFVYDSGFYEANGSTWFGDYISPHTQRDAEWPRRSHDCLDITHGANDAPQLGKKAVPCVLGEPQKAGLATPADYKAYCANGVQVGVGCALHSETGKFAQLPTPQEAAVAAAALEGLNAFSGDTNRGAYRRIDGDGLRTYVVGSTMVRIRPNRPAAPEPGWTSLDSAGILWRR